MDVWAWLAADDAALREEGFGRLVELVRQLPNHAVNGRASEVAAIVPEALALAKAAGRPWYEVFVHHWSLQSRVTDQAHGETALLDAVAALDLAHADATADCPQSVCVVQDLCLAYGATDGPAYVDERLAVCDETLGRIDPSWSCWLCLTEEKADALLDAGRYDEAQQLLDEAIAKLPAQDHAADRLVEARVTAALGQGRTGEAMAAVEAAEAAKNPWSGRRHETSRVLDRARALAALGRHEAAWEALPPVDDVVPAQYARWAEVRCRIADAEATPHPLTTAHRSLLRRWRGLLADRGAWHDAQTLAELVVRSAIGAGVAVVARRDLDHLDEIVAHRRRPEREAGRRAELAHLLDRSDPPAIDLPGSPESLVSPAAASGGEPDDHEADVERFAAAAARWPDDEQVALLLAVAWANAGDRAMARDLLVARLRSDPSPAAARLLGTIVLDAGAAGADALRSVEDDLRLGDPVAADVVWAHKHHRDGDWAACAERCAAALAIRPEALETRRLWSDALLRAGRHQEALEQARRVLSDAESPTGNDRWLVVMAASAVGSWSDVRAQAVELGWDVEPGDAPLEVLVERCTVRFPDGSQEVVDRTGPATGTVASIAPPERPQRFGLRLLIEPLAESRSGGDANDANDANDADDDDDGDGPPPLPAYPLLSVLAEVDAHAFEVLGRWNDGDGWTSLRSRLQAIGASIWLHGAGFRISAPGTASDPGPDPDAAAAEGMWASVATTSTADEAVAELWTTFRATEWDGPLLAPALAEAAGEPEVAARQRAEADAWGL